MNGELLFVVTSHAALGSSGNPSGLWLEELAAPYWILRDAGMEPIIASPKGGEAPIDPMSLEERWMSDAGRRFMSDPEAVARLRHTVPLDELVSSSFAGIYLVGGTAATFDFPGNLALNKLVLGHFANASVVAGICHGVIGLADATDEAGEPIVKGRQITCISDAEDIMMGVEKVVPVLPEQMMRKLRAIYSAAPPLAPHVVCDPPFFTGQNPASAEPLGQQILKYLNRRSAEHGSRDKTAICD